jgi:hypothetical protein
MVMGQKNKISSWDSSVLKYKILIFLCAVVCPTQCSEISERFLLSKFPPGLTCTVHLKYFSSDGLVAKDTFESVVLSNKGTALLTLWSNDSLLVSPIIQFFEQCSINILIEKQSLILSSTRQFLIYTNYASRGPLHSIYILIKWECAERAHYEPQALQMELSLFAHFMGTCKNDRKAFRNFPSFSFIPFALNNGSATGIFSPIQIQGYDSIFVKPSLHPNHPSYTIDCVSATVRGNGLSCFRNLRLQRCNSYRQFLLGHLEGLLNFTCRYKTVYYDRRGKSASNGFGWIMMDALLDDRGLDFVNLRTPEGTTSAKIAYCDFTNRNSRLQLQDWIKPMETNIWVALAVSMFASAILCCLHWDTNLESFEFDKILFEASAVIFVGLVLRQYSSKIKHHVLFSSFALAILTLVTLYETQITVELVAPRKPLVIKDLAELVHEKEYRIYMIAHSEAHKLKEMDYLNNHLNLIGENRLLNYEDVIFAPGFNLSFFGKQGVGDETKRVAMFDRPSLDPSIDLLTFIRKQNPTVNCYYVKRPAGSDWIVAIFNNIMGLKQIKLFRKFFNAGLAEMWKKLALSRKLSKFRAMSRRKDERERGNNSGDNHIRLENLNSILIALEVLITIAFLLLLSEVYIHFLCENTHF